MKKRILSILLCLCVVMTFMPTVALAETENGGGAATTSADSLTFGYAYDVQRSPDYPTQNQEVSMTNITAPLKANAYPSGDKYQTSAGTWTLTKTGAYATLESPSTNLSSVVSYLAIAYSISASGTIIVHELKNGSDHVAYGVLVAYDRGNGKALFLGDNWNAGGAGYLLSETEISGNSAEITAGEILTVFIPEHEIYLDKSGTQTFAAATVGYAAQSPLSIKVSNTGTAATGELAVTLSGTNADSFELSATTIADIDSGENTTFTVTPKTGLAAGTYTATVSVSNTDVSAKTFDVSFTVKPASSSHSGSSYKRTLTVEISEGTDVKTETLPADGSKLISSVQGNVSVSKDESSVTITPNEGYEIESVTLNGVDKGSVDTLAELSSTDKLIVKFKEKSVNDDTDKQTQDKAQLAKAKSLVESLSLTARSAKTAKKNIKVSLKTDKTTDAAIKELKALGYTIKYKFYRSTEKSSKYAAKITKNSKNYMNTTGKKGAKYYYKARIQVFDENGNLVAQTELKQCKYACRQWTK